MKKDDSYFDDLQWGGCLRGLINILIAVALTVLLIMAIQSL